MYLSNLGKFGGSWFSSTFASKAQGHKWVGNANYGTWEEQLLSGLHYQHANRVTAADAGERMHQRKNRERHIVPARPTIILQLPLFSIRFALEFQVTNMVTETDSTNINSIIFLSMFSSYETQFIAHLRKSGELCGISHWTLENKNIVSRFLSKISTYTLCFNSGRTWISFVTVAPRLNRVLWSLEWQIFGGLFSRFNCESGEIFNSSYKFTCMRSCDSDCVHGKFENCHRPEIFYRKKPRVI